MPVSTATWTSIAIEVMVRLLAVAILEALGHVNFGCGLASIRLPPWIDAADYWPALCEKCHVPMAIIIGPLHAKRQSLYGNKNGHVMSST